MATIEVPDNGETGQYLQYVIGSAQWVDLPTVQGQRGERGKTGVRGVPGVPGQRGATGDVGPRGPIGPKGDKGDKGDKGESGDSAATAAITALSNRIAELEYDTGWRNVTGTLINGWTATSVQVRRTGRRGIIRFQGLNGTAATGDYFLALPSGFFAGGQNILVAISVTPYSMWVQGSGTQLSIPRTIPVSSSFSMTDQYLGDLAKPTSLPGTAV